MRQKKNIFSSAKKLGELIAQYFADIEGRYHYEGRPAKGSDATIQQKVYDREPEPATIAGLAFHLGFSSREAFEDYEVNGKFADQLKRARLRVMADYEKKLHVTSSTGAIFALKSMGWNERTENKPLSDINHIPLKVEIIQSGPEPASSEKEVV